MNLTFPLLGLWGAAGVYYVWWVYILWTSPGVLYVGNIAELAFWLIPVLPVFIASWRWRIHRTRTRQWVFWRLVALWVVTLCIPWQEPTHEFSETVDRSIIPVSFTLMMGLSTVTPLVTVLTMLFLFTRSYRNIETHSISTTKIETEQVT